MDRNDGCIYTPEQMEKLAKNFKEHIPLKDLMEMKIPPTPKQMKRKPPKVGRNEVCPCGSEIKFKKCCLNKS